MSIVKNVSQRDLRKLQKKGFNVSEVKKPEVKSEDKFLLVAQKVIDAFKSALELNTKTSIDFAAEFQKQTGIIAKVIEKETPKKEFDLIVTERNKQGSIQKVKIKEI
jgi:hypothetical protein